MLHVTPGRACHMLRRDRQTPLTPAKHTHTQPILPHLPLRNAKQRNAKQTVMLRVAYVTLGRLCQMLLRGAHVTRGRYPFLFARHETFLVQNLSQRCCCCAMTAKGITEKQRHDRGAVQCLRCQSSRSLQRESKYCTCHSKLFRMTWECFLGFRERFDSCGLTGIGLSRNGYG